MFARLTGSLTRLHLSKFHTTPLLVEQGLIVAHNYDILNITSAIFGILPNILFLFSELIHMLLMALSRTCDSISISGQDNKHKSKDFINQNILPAVCALLNSEGGTIEITQIKLDIRSIEQAVTKITGEAACSTFVEVKRVANAEGYYKILVDDFKYLLIDLAQYFRTTKT